MVIDDSTHLKTEEANFQFGRWLSSPQPGEEVVISGVSGRFPESNNVYEFRDNLFSKKDMVTDDDRRWKTDDPKRMEKTAKIFDIDKFDAGYFGIHHRQADVMDPLLRILMETTVEAVMDAGVNPSELEGSRTGVFVCLTWSDSSCFARRNIMEPQRFRITGMLQTCLTHRISYYLKLRAPSSTIDAACSGSLYALDLAFKSIRNGQCDKAIVGGVNLALRPRDSEVSSAGTMSSDGKCKVFDQDADGYVRAEAITSIFLQKAKHSRRIYAQVVHTKANTDGFKEQGIHFPSSEAQKQLMTEVYNESGVNPSKLSYMEAHGTGTAVGDPQEVRSIDLALAQNRQKPLLVGSVKSNIGHTEAASGLCSIIKAILAMETGIIAPNIHLKQIKKGLTGLEEGRMKVVTDLTSLEGDEVFVGINNFGIGGTNAHTILKRFCKKKTDGGIPKDDIPRLVCVSGRTKESVLKFLHHLSSKNLDQEYVGLLHNIYKTNISGHLYRGFAIVSKGGLTQTSVKLSKNRKNPLCIYFGKMEHTFEILSFYFLKFPVFKDTLSRIDEVLAATKKFGMKIENDEIKRLRPFCVQLGIVSVLRELEIKPAAVYGDTYGKLACAYYEDTISLEDVISSAMKMNQSASQFEPYFEQCVRRQRWRKTRNGILNSLNHTYNNVDNYSFSLDALKNCLILNASDSRMTNNDVLLVENGCVRFLQTIGSIYEHGYNPQLHKLYPEVKFPVNRGTPMVSPLIQWNHNKKWYTYSFDESSVSSSMHKVFTFSSLENDQKYIAGHVVDGRNLIPATEYLRLVWETLAQSQSLSINETSIIFKNCKFIKAVTMPETGILTLIVTIQQGTGDFEVLEKDSIVVSGSVFLSAQISQNQIDFQPIELSKESTEVLEEDEFYREMYLRGYHYRQGNNIDALILKKKNSGVFKGIVRCNIQGTSGLIRWENNWTSFIDKMLQINVLSTKTRSLYVPVGIEKLTINPKKHLEIANTLDKQETLFPVYVYEKCCVVKSGGIEISGLEAKSILKRKLKSKPVLEKHVFIPNCGRLKLSEAVRVIVQLILENTSGLKFEGVEIIDDNANCNLEPLSFIMAEVIDDVPTTTSNLTISTTSAIEERLGVKVEEVALSSKSNLPLIVGSNFFQSASTLCKILKSLSNDGFVLTRERVDFVPEACDDIEIITEYTTSDEKLILFQKTQYVTIFEHLEISSTNLQWLPELQKLILNDNEVVLYAKNKEPEGLLGLVNCIRREPNGHKIKCFFMMDDTPHFNPDDIFYQNQIKKGLAINISKNNVWGTYRYLYLEKLQTDCVHSYATVKEIGDLSSFDWFEGPLTAQTQLSQDELLISTYYSALNFKDIMVASGRVTVEDSANRHRSENSLIGFEFSGIDMSGRRVLGMGDAGAISSLIVVERNAVLEIPDNWSLEDAATVPAVYSTVLSALFLYKPLQRGSSILIHSATGGVGLAALNVCLYYNCNIFVTVGSQEKREYLIKHFPQIPENHIGNSHDTSFEEMIKSQTRNRGVDYVLNSLIGDKLLASVRCLGQDGCFLELGKHDSSDNTQLNLSFIKKDASFHRVMLDVHNKRQGWRSKVADIIRKGIKAGFVKPLPRVVFDRTEVEKAHKHMMTGKHIGKVLVRIREERGTDTIPERTFFKATPKFYCACHNSYIIVGALGGVGLELTDWLVRRGATKLVLVSRFGIQNGYQKRHLRNLESRGVKIKVSLQDVTTKQGCINLIQEAQELGPVDGIFNLAMILKDALLEEQTEESFAACFAPKAKVTKYLDEVTRESCPNLRYFVAFSSVCCGRGNPGQSNYGMANSIMERICEKRKKDGLPAVAIQWGAIGEVGLVAKMQTTDKELVIGGFAQQKISSCLEVLDIFLKQDSPVVSSMVIAGKHKKSRLSAAETVADILGIQNIKTVSQHSTLAELGMDSLAATEVKQVLEADFDLYITPKDLRIMTFARLNEIEAFKKANGGEERSRVKQQDNMFFQDILSFGSDYSPTVIPSHQDDENAEVTVFMLTGTDGSFNILENLMKQLNARVICLPYNYRNPEDTIEQTALGLISQVEINLQLNKKCIFVCYSFGTLVGLEMVSLLEAKGYLGHLILIDGSPNYLNSVVQATFPETESEFETLLISKILAVALPVEKVFQNKQKFLECRNFDERLDLAVALAAPVLKNKEKLVRQHAAVMNKRCKAMRGYGFNHDKIKSTVHLFKPKEPLISIEDYQLEDICEKLGRVVTVDGSHLSMVNQPELVAGINEILSNI